MDPLADQFYDIVALYISRYLPVRVKSAALWQAEIACRSRSSFGTFGVPATAFMAETRICTKWDQRVGQSWEPDSASTLGQFIT